MQIGLIIIFWLGFLELKHLFLWFCSIISRFIHLKNILKFQISAIKINRLLM